MNTLRITEEIDPYEVDCLPEGRLLLKGIHVAFKGHVRSLAKTLIENGGRVEPFSSQAEVAAYVLNNFVGGNGAGNFRFACP